jgi:hypothetical protein
MIHCGTFDIMWIMVSKMSRIFLYLNFALALKSEAFICKRSPIVIYRGHMNAVNLPSDLKLDIMEPG